MSVKLYIIYSTVMMSDDTLLYINTYSQAPLFLSNPHNSHDIACSFLKISSSLIMKGAVQIEGLTLPHFFSLQTKLRTVLQCVLSLVSVHHTSCLCHGLCRTHMDADCSERRSRLTERKNAQQ